MKKQEQLLQAVDKNDLLQQLQDLHFDVPKRNQGRKKIHVEKYSVFQFLRVMAQNDKLLYPFALFYGDKPDFVASTSNLNIGIEVVEAIPQNKALEQAERAQLPKRNTWGRLYNIKERNKALDEIKNEIEIENEIVISEDDELGADIMDDKVIGISFLGDEIEIRWSEAIESFVSKKRKILNKNDFQKFEKNWLIVYDNWPAPALDYKKALPLLKDKVIIKQTGQHDFDSIFLLDEHRLIPINL
jgi:hypothetical protein